MDIVPIYAETLIGQPLFSTSTQKTQEIIVGNGFFAEGNHFFTASHVIIDTQNENGKGNPYIKYNGCRVELKIENALSYMTIPSDCKGAPMKHHIHTNGDIAIFEIENAESNFVLSESLPKYGQTLKNSFFSKKSGKEEIIQTVGIVHSGKDFTGNFYAATMIPSHPINGGSSGSPLYLGNTVYGILHGGGSHTLPDICVFFSSASTLQLLRQHVK